jgi:hypothetical protein
MTLLCFYSCHLKILVFSHLPLLLCFLLTEFLCRSLLLLHLAICSSNLYDRRYGRNQEYQCLRRREDERLSEEYKLAHIPVDWVMPTHTGEGNLLCSSVISSNVHQLWKHPHRHTRNDNFPAIWASQTQSSWHMKLTVMLH